MDSPNDLCGFCGVRTATHCCPCTFPIAKLCSEVDCQNAHVKVPGRMHFDLPLASARYLTTAEEVRVARRNSLGLFEAKEELQSAISRLEGLGQEIEAVFETYVAALCALKEEYYELLWKFREAAAQAANEAIAETIEHTGDTKYRPEGDLKKWIWAGIDQCKKQSELFELKLNHKSPEDLRQIFSLEFTTEMEVFKALARDIPSFSSQQTKREEVTTTEAEGLKRQKVEIDQKAKLAATDRELATVREELKNVREESNSYRRKLELACAGLETVLKKLKAVHVEPKTVNEKLITGSKETESVQAGILKLLSSFKYARETIKRVVAASKKTQNTLDNPHVQSNERVKSMLKYNLSVALDALAASKGTKREFKNVNELLTMAGGETKLIAQKAEALPDQLANALKAIEEMRLQML